MAELKHAVPFAALLWKLGANIRKPILTLAMMSLVFSLGIVADETLKPNGWWWGKISDVRRLGYLEGFVDGSTDAMLERLCEKTTLPSLRASGNCILYRLQQDTQVEVNTGTTLETLNKFYSVPQNLPVRWNHAVIVSRAIVSGVPVEEKDLQVIRQEDAKSAQ